MHKRLVVIPVLAPLSLVGEALPKTPRGRRRCRYGGRESVVPGCRSPAFWLVGGAHPSFGGFPDRNSWQQVPRMGGGHHDKRPSRPHSSLREHPPPCWLTQMTDHVLAVGVNRAAPTAGAREHVAAWLGARGYQIVHDSQFGRRSSRLPPRLVAPVQ
jgi:hypothetical protein